MEKVGKSEKTGIHSKVQTIVDGKGGKSDSCRERQDLKYEDNRIVIARDEAILLGNGYASQPCMFAL